jgi:hypothetical protein
VLNMQPCRGRKPALGSAAHCRSRLCVTQASPDMASRAGRRSPQKRRYRTKSVGELQCGSVNEWEPAGNGRLNSDITDNI